MGQKFINKSQYPSKRRTRGMSQPKTLKSLTKMSAAAAGDQQQPDRGQIQESADKSNRVIVETPMKPPTSTPIVSSNKVKNDNVLTCIGNSNHTSNSFEDEESLRGRFGWELIGQNHLPYIIRTSEKYCSVRMVEMKVLNQYLKLLHADIYNYTCIISYYISVAESSLLNTINIAHCDNQFGCEQFTYLDLIVRLTDVIELYNFLDTCYTILSKKNTKSVSRCGFIRINRSSIVPYTVYSDEKYVPLFYFEGETDTLKLKGHKLEGWALSYLKFCCKVQGIRCELFCHESCTVTRLVDLKKYFPPDTLFEEYWPSEHLNSSLLINGNTDYQPGQWFRKPAEPPVSYTHLLPVPKPVTKVKAATKYLHKVQNKSYSLTSVPPPANQSAASHSSSRPVIQNSCSSSRSALPPLIRLNQQSSVDTNAQTTGPTDLSKGKSTPSGQVRSKTTKLPVTLLNGQYQYATHRNRRKVAAANCSPAISTEQSNHPPLIDQSHVQTQSHDTQNNIVNTPISMDAVAATPSSEAHVPYQMQLVLVDDRAISCINMKPYVYTEYLVTISDLIENLFNNVSIESCRQAMQVLGIELYKGNESQMRVLHHNGKCQDINDNLLVPVGIVSLYMSQLKYMLAH